MIAAAESTVSVPAPPTVTACCSAILPAVVRSSTSSVAVVIAPCSVSVPPAVSVTALLPVLSMRSTVTPSFSAISIASWALTSSVSASSVVSTAPVVASRVPAVTVPFSAVNVTAPALARLPMVTLPFSEVMLTRPATPVMALMRMSPSATMVMSPPVVASIAIEVIVSEPVSPVTAGLMLSVMVRSPGFVKAMARLSTRVVSVRSSPALTFRVCVVTVPPSVRLSVAASVMFEPCRSETTTSEADAAAGVVPLLA